jgi:AcrR family transcriptional regulator
MVQKNNKPPSAAKIDAPKINAPRIDLPKAPKRRGRPRAYEPEVALGKALDLFRRDGFTSTSLDDLSAATGMNRPSLYGAFGDKRELYIKSYQRYRDDARTAMVDIFRSEAPLRDRLKRIYAIALDIYLSGESGPRGCFTVMTAASEAVSDPDIRAMVVVGLTELDKAFATCFRLAKERGELPDAADPTALAALASATIHTVAIRARARVPRKELEAIVQGALDVLCRSK